LSIDSWIGGPKRPGVIGTLVLFARGVLWISDRATAFR
jgi:hypothetical protein